MSTGQLSAEIASCAPRHLRPIDYERATVDPELTAEYFEWYGLDTESATHVFGTFRSGGFTLAAHAFLPPTPRATVIVMHGYLDHSGSHGATVRHLLARGYAVATYDQPGHGLSSGRRASIDDFAVYTTIFRGFLALCRAHMPPPYHALAHSTGAAIVVDHLLSAKSDVLGQVVLAAPLVRSAQWAVSTTFAPVLDAFVDDMPRVFRDNTSDPDYADFVRRDPLQPKHTSVDWFNALVAWNGRMESYPANNRPIVIVQGDEDSVVDWQYNIGFLRSRFPAARVEMIAGGHHQLLNEAPKLKGQVLRIVDETLSTDARAQ